MVFNNYNQTNNASGSLLTLISNSSTILILNSGEGEKFPTTNFKVRIRQFDASGIYIKQEIALCTSRSGDILTVIRANEECPLSQTSNTQQQQAQAFSVGSSVDNVFTAGNSDDIQTELVRLEDEKLDESVYNSEKVQKGTSSTGTDSYQATISTVSSYVNGQRFQIGVDVSNTSTATFEANSLGAKAIKIGEDGSFVDIPTNTITAGGFMNLTYITSGDFFQYTDDPGNVVASTSSATQSSVMVGEDVNAGDGIRAGSLTASSIINQATTNTAIQIGYSNGTLNYEIGQSFVATGTSIKNVSLFLYKSGNPNSVWNARIYSDANLSTLIATSTNTKPASELSTSTAGEEVSFNFNSDTIVEGNTYYVRLGFFSGIPSTSNYIWVKRYTGNGYTGGNEFRVGSGLEITNQSGDLKFNIEQGITEDINKFYKTSALSVFSCNLAGFANEATTSGNLVNLNTAGVDGNQTFLEADIGKSVYLSDTPGEISTTPGTNVVKVGKISSTTEVEIDTFNNDNLNGKSTTSATTGGVTLGNAEGYITIKVNGVDKKIPYYGV